MTKPHICHVFPSFGLGGPEVRTATLLDESAERFRHTVLSLSGDFSGRCRLRQAGRVEFAAAARPVRQLASQLRRLKPDLILTYGWGGVDAVVAARLAGRRNVIHTEDGFLPDEAVRQKWKRLMARRVVLRLVQNVIVPSRTLEQIATQTWWLSSAVVRYLPNGVDTERFRPAGIERVRRPPATRDGEFVVAALGRLRAEKNYARLIRLIAALPDRRVKLLLVGDGPEREALCALTAALNVSDRVWFAGAVENPVELLQASDVFAVTSDTEQMPIAVLEAMAVGLPVVSTDVGDVRAMLSSENLPFVHPREDEAALAKSLERLVGDAQLRSAIGAANRRKCVALYSLSAMVRGYLDLFEQALR